MDIRSLRVFVGLSETLSFTRTAQQQHMSLSAVSRTLQRIEDELGQRLFERDQRQVRLTPAGEQFRDYARESLQRWQQMLGELRVDEAAMRGEISVYCSVTASYSVLSPILEQFRAAHPGIDIMLHTGDQADAVGRIQAGQEDVAVAACPDRLAPKLDFLVLQQSPLQFIVPDFPCAVTGQLADMDSDADDFDWGDLPFIVAERGLSKERLDVWFRESGRRPRIYAQVAGHEAIAAMVGLGLGVGVVPGLVLENSTFRDKLRVVAVRRALRPFPVGLCALRQRLDNPLVAAFWSIARRSYPAAI